MNADARRVWDEGFASLLGTPGLRALRDALRADDPRLSQGSTTTPPTLVCVADWPVEAACLLGFCGWRGDNLERVGEVERFFNDLCREADERLGEVAGCRHLLNFWDDTPRAEAVAAMLPLVEAELARRGAA